MQMETISTMIKETLTNATKYSKASEINIELETNEKYTRLYYKDNGVGCSQIHRGIGIKGMQERVDNLGGSLNIS